MAVCSTLKSRTGKEARPICALCSKHKLGNCQTQWQCSTCEVPLCCVNFNKQDDGDDDDEGDDVDTGPRSCFALWHEAHDLMIAHEHQHALMMAAKGGNKRKRNNNLDDDDDNDLDYNYEDDLDFGNYDDEEDK